MKISKIIKQTIGKKLAALDFTYGHLNNTWFFTREVNGFKENIRIDKSNWYENALRIIYYNSITSVASTHFENNNNVEEWYYYEDEESLRKLLVHFQNITQNYALKWFESIRPKNILPPENFLSELWKLKAKEFMKQNDINFQSFESLTIIERILQNEPLEETVFVISYFIGEFFIGKFGGEWVIDGNFGPVIQNIGGIKGFNRNPYKMVTNYIRSPQEYSIIGHYTTILNTLDSLKKSEL